MALASSSSEEEPQKLKVYLPVLCMFWAELCPVRISSYGATQVHEDAAGSFRRLDPRLYNLDPPLVASILFQRQLVPMPFIDS